MSETLTRQHENRMYREIPFRSHTRGMREKAFRATFSGENKHELSRRILTTL